LSASRQQRAVQNRRLVGDLAASSDAATEVLLLCECGSERCGSRLRITRRQYERARERKNRFIVAPGHHARADAVVLVADSFWIVEPGSSAA